MSKPTPKSPRNNFLEDVSITCPDDSTIRVTITGRMTYEKNPFDKPAERYRGEDDGWIVEAIEVQE